MFSPPAVMISSKIKHKDTQRLRNRLIMDKEKYSKAYKDLVSEGTLNLNTDIHIHIRDSLSEIH